MRIAISFHETEDVFDRRGNVFDPDLLASSKFSEISALEATYVVIEYGSLVVILCVRAGATEAVAAR